jgi:hypothetical protein
MLSRVGEGLGMQPQPRVWGMGPMLVKGLSLSQSCGSGLGTAIGPMESDTGPFWCLG